MHLYSEGLGALKYKSDRYVPIGERRGGGAFSVGFQREKGSFGVGSKDNGLFGVNFPK